MHIKQVKLRLRTLTRESQRTVIAREFSCAVVDSERSRVASSPSPSRGYRRAAMNALENQLLQWETTPTDYACACVCVGDSSWVQELQRPDSDRAIQPKEQCSRWVSQLMPCVCVCSLIPFHFSVHTVGRNGSGKSNFFYGTTQNFVEMFNCLFCV